MQRIPEAAAALFALLAPAFFGCGPAEPALREARISEIQGSGHLSSLAGQAVRTRGIVTAIDARDDDGNPGFWIEDPDGDEATSNGIFVATGGAPEVEVGHEVEVDGTVEEFAPPEREEDLTLTRLVASEVRAQGGGRDLPPPVRLGNGGRRTPEVVDDDGLSVFEPEADAIDFFESLEGMRVEIADAVAISGTTRHGELTVLADGGAGSGPRTPRGGLLLTKNDEQPERLTLAPRLLGEMPAVDVGTRFEAPVVGILDYSFGRFKILPTAPLAPIAPDEAPSERTPLRPGEGQLSLATMNVYNLSARDPKKKLERLATTLVRDLQSPDIVALQEVQDENGKEDDGTTDAVATFEALLYAVEAAGGPRYDFRQIDPVDGADGGQPGANIRVGFLFHPRRIEFVDRGEARATDAVAVGRGADRAELSASPGRISPADPAFAESRKPLAGEFLFRGRRIFVVATHLCSKGDDDPLMGRRQPPRRASEEQRMGQVRALRAFMDSLLEADPQARVVVLGDMNEMPFRAPMAALIGEDWVNLIERVPVEDRYTFNYSGLSQVLDHVIVSPALAARAAPEIDIVHVHADLAHRHRGSDHDPVVIRLDLEAR